MSDWIDKTFPMPKHAVQEQTFAREVIEKFCAEVQKRAEKSACEQGPEGTLCALCLEETIEQLLKEIRATS